MKCAVAEEDKRVIEAYARSHGRSVSKVVGRWLTGIATLLTQYPEEEFKSLEIRTSVHRNH